MGGSGLWPLRTGSFGFGVHDGLGLRGKLALGKSDVRLKGSSTFQVQELAFGDYYQEGQLCPQNHSKDGLLGPNSIMVVYMDPLGSIMRLNYAA